MRPGLFLGTAVVLGAVSSGVEATRQSARLAPPNPAVAADAIATIIAAFRSHRVVALGEGPHGNEEGHTFRLSLIRDPRFVATVNDILVEFGSGRYQDLMDRFVNGEDVPRERLRHVWQDSTVGTAVWERPIYEDFFRSVRALNLSLSPERRLRVLLGDAPIDWERVRRREDLQQWGKQKDRHAGNLIKREVLAKQRRALVIYGDGHLQGRGFPPASLINVLERPPSPTKVFAISSSFADLSRIQADVKSWPVPSIATVRGTVIGARPYAFFYPLPPARGWNTVRMEDQFDAVLYLGATHPGTPSRFPPELCLDKAYMTMRLRRLKFEHPAVSKASSEALQAYCRAQAPKQNGLTSSVAQY
jgi:hypothetical protein